MYGIGLLFKPKQELFPEVLLIILTSILSINISYNHTDFNEMWNVELFSVTAAIKEAEYTFNQLHCRVAGGAGEKLRHKICGIILTWKSQTIFSGK